MTYAGRGVEIRERALRVVDTPDMCVLCASLAGGVRRSLRCDSSVGVKTGCGGATERTGVAMRGVEATAGFTPLVA